MHHAAQAHNLELSHEESVLKLEHKVLVEEGHDCQAFLEASSVALQAWPTEAHGALVYPCYSLLVTCHWLPCWLPPLNWLQWVENHW